MTPIQLERESLAAEKERLAHEALQREVARYEAEATELRASMASLQIQAEAQKRRLAELDEHPSPLRIEPRSGKSGVVGALLKKTPRGEENPRNPSTQRRGRSGSESKEDEEGSLSQESESDEEPRRGSLAPMVSDHQGRSALHPSLLDVGVLRVVCSLSLSLQQHVPYRRILSLRPKGALEWDAVECVEEALASPLSSPTKVKSREKQHTRRKGSEGPSPKGHVSAGTAPMEQVSSPMGGRGCDSETARLQQQALALFLTHTPLLFSRRPLPREVAELTRQLQAQQQPPQVPQPTQQQQQQQLSQDGSPPPSPKHNTWVEPSAAHPVVPPHPLATPPWVTAPHPPTPPGYVSPPEAAQELCVQPHRDGATATPHLHKALFSPGGLTTLGRPTLEKMLRSYEKERIVTAQEVERLMGAIRERDSTIQGLETECEGLRRRIAQQPPQAVGMTPLRDELRSPAAHDFFDPTLSLLTPAALDSGATYLAEQLQHEVSQGQAELAALREQEGHTSRGAEAAETARLQLQVGISCACSCPTCVWTLRSMRARLKSWFWPGC